MPAVPECFIAEETLDRVDPDPNLLRTGDLLGFRIQRKFQHLAIYTGDGIAHRMVHAYSGTGNDHQFSQLRMPFRQEGWVITVDDAALRGAVLGATASGTVTKRSVARMFRRISVSLGMGGNHRYGKSLL